MPCQHSTILTPRAGTRSRPISHHALINTVKRVPRAPTNPAGVAPRTLYTLLTRSVLVRALSPVSSIPALYHSETPNIKSTPFWLTGTLYIPPRSTRMFALVCDCVIFTLLASAQGCDGSTSPSHGVKMQLLDINSELTSTIHMRLSSTLGWVVAPLSGAYSSHLSPHLHILLPRACSGDWSRFRCTSRLHTTSPRGFAICKP
jgi:hypothetical protein